MRVLVLGGDGMLGHRLLLQLQAHHEVRVTLRNALTAYARHGLFNTTNAVGDVDARHFERIESCAELFRPQAIINAIGVVKQRPDAADSATAIEINALLPHRLAQLCGRIGARLVHLSTDCVFSGRKGNYSEADLPDADDLYGRSKLLGEVEETPCLTLRTSIIGPELSRKTGLLEWFLAQRDAIKGYRRAIFSGFTTLEMARIIERVLTAAEPAHGLYHVSSDAISKYDLLTLIKRRLGLATEITPDDEFACDRSLDSTRFRTAYAYAPPPWATMIDELATSMRQS